MTNSCTTGILGSRFHVIGETVRPLKIPGSAERAKQPGEPIAWALLANLIADLRTWIGCSWAVAVDVTGGVLKLVHVAGVQPDLDGCMREAGAIAQLPVEPPRERSRDPWSPPRLSMSVRIGAGNYVLLFGPQPGDVDYTAADRQLVSDAAAQTSTLLENERLAGLVAADRTAMAGIRDDLRTARDVQSRLFPLRLPRISGLDCFGESRPAAEVGGDFFDFVALPGDGVAVSIGDVSGHGIGAAILMAGLQVRLRALTQRCNEIDAIIRELNREVYSMSPDSFFATLFYAHVDRPRQRLRYVNAGQDGALLIRNGGSDVERLETTGAVLGLSQHACFEQRSVAVHAGDVLVACTDCGAETTGADSDQAWEARIRDLVRSDPDARASDLAWRIVEAYGSAPPVTDQTVVVVRFTDSSQEHAVWARPADLFPPRPQQRVRPAKRELRPCAAGS